jgi:uncharacterized membrane protein YfcA
MDMLLDWPLLLASLLTLGVVAGFMAGLLGVGGGAVLVPGLYYIFRFVGVDDTVLMHMALGTSLAIIVPTSISSTRAHWKKSAVDLDLVRKLGPGIVLGTMIGSVIADMVSGESLQVLFAVAVAFLAVLMVSKTTSFSLLPQVPPQPWVAISGGFIGVISTLIGIGGASLSVPYMTMCRVPIHRAIGTAAGLGLIISIPASVGFMIIGWGVPLRPEFSLGYISLPAWALVIGASMFCAPFGARLAHSLPVEGMRKIFALFLILLALKMGSDIWL